MSKRGPKPQPTELKKARGNPGRRSLDTGEFHPPISPLPIPAHLKPKVTAFYRHYAAMLVDLRVMTEADWFAFRVMAEHYALALDALERARLDGLTLVGAQMNVVKHPLLQVWRDNSAAFLRYAAEFGLTPSARSSVQPVPEAEQLTLESLLYGENVTIGQED